MSGWRTWEKPHWGHAMPQSDIAKLVFEQCALCNRISDLQASHIIPGFVFDWVRNTSSTGHFRSSKSPNLRVQDGLKPRMLCKDCEQLFSLWEKKFSEECFVPLNNGDVRSIGYGPWMLKFATSVSWRVLRVFSATDGLAGFPNHLTTKVNDALQEWSQFLRGEKPNPGPHEQHMFVVDVIHSTSFPDAPSNISRYLARAVEIFVAHAQDAIISYAKLGRFVLFGFVAVKHPRRWKGTKLHVRHGQFGQHDIELPADIGEFIFDRARLAAEKYSQISELQHEKIKKSYEQSPDRAVHSETFRAMHQDVLMFGKSAFEATQPSDLRRAEKGKQKVGQ